MSGTACSCKNSVFQSLIPNKSSSSRDPWGLHALWCSFGALSLAVELQVLIGFQILTIACLMFQYKPGILFSLSCAGSHEFFLSLPCME